MAQHRSSLSETLETSGNNEVQEEADNDLDNIDNSTDQNVEQNNDQNTDQIFVYQNASNSENSNSISLAPFIVTSNHAGDFSPDKDDTNTSKETTDNMHRCKQYPIVTSTDTSDIDIDKEIELQKRNISERKVWITSSYILICYVVTLFSLIPISTQFFTDVIAKEDYNETISDSDKNGCSNSSKSPEREDIENAIQKDASNLILYGTITSGIPASFTSLVVGSYSDYIGRRPLLMCSISGQIVKTVILVLVIKLDWNRYIYLIGCGVDGLLGSYYTTTLAVTAVIADITPNPKGRAVHFAVIEAILFVTGSVAQIGIGYLIKESFFIPVVICAGLMTSALLVLIIFLPETLQSRREIQWNPAVHLRKVFGFYVLDGSRLLKSLYITALSSFFFNTLTNHGRLNVETLYELHEPICWNSVQIGYFLAIRLTAMSIIGVIVLRVFKYKLSLEVIGIVGALSATAGFTIEGLADNGSQMYIAALVGILYVTCLPIPRALMSQLTKPTEQGALFSSLSSLETFSSMISGAMYNIIYNATIDSFNGAVFFVMAVMCIINAVMLGAHRYLRKRFEVNRTQEIDVISPTQNKATDQECSEQTPLIDPA